MRSAITTLKCLHNYCCPTKWIKPLVSLYDLTPAPPERFRDKFFKGRGELDTAATKSFC